MSMNNTGSNLLFIEIRDKKVSLFLSKLREVLSKKSSFMNIHITIKGPQKTKFKTVNIRRFLENKIPIKVGGSGMFINGDNHVVYLKVECKELLKYKLWYKPSYKEQFNPHITMYEGNDKKRAHAVFDFLSREDLRVIFTEYDVIQTSLKQGHLDFVNASEPDGDSVDLVVGNSIDKEVIYRAKKLVDSLAL